MISVRGLAVDRGGQRVLSGLDLSLAPGESVSVMGPSGSGKSTLLHCLAGLIRPDSGSIESNGVTIDRLTSAQRRAWRLANCGLVFQFGELLPELTLRENAVLPLLLLGMRRSEAVSRVDHLLSQVHIDEVADRTPAAVSGGQMQRAAVVRALAHRPALVLADEPTGALDAESGKIVLEMLLGLVRDGDQALVVVTHDRSVAATTDRQLVMAGGAVHTGASWS